MIKALLKAIYITTILSNGLTLYSQCGAMSDFSVEMNSANFFDLDSNNPESMGPQTAYVSFKICNTSGITKTSLTANLYDLTQPLTDPAGQTVFQLSGGQDAVQTVGQGGTLVDNECDVIYWLVTTNADMETAQSDPISAHGRSTTISVEVLENGVSNCFGQGTVTTRSSISASAGGLTDMINPGPGAYLGQVFSVTVQYDFGNPQNGDIYNLQPIGNIDFAADCFQLKNLEILSSPIPGVDAGLQDSLHFVGQNVNGSGPFIVEVIYFFSIECITAGSTSVEPYASQQSGNQYKYTGNFGDPLAVTTIPAPVNGITISKSVNLSSVDPLSLPTIVQYTVSLTNTTSGTNAVDLSVDKITDNLPAMFEFTSFDASSDINTTNSSSYPSAMATGTIEFIGGIPDPSNFPYTSYVVPASSSIDLIYNVTIPVGTSQCTFNNSANFTIENTTSNNESASVSVGSGLACNSTSNSPICEGNTIQLNETGGSATTWAWEGPNGFTSSIQNPSISNAMSINAGIYTVTVTDGGACTNSCTVNVEVNDSPTAEAGASDELTCTITSLMLDAAAGSSGQGSLSYAWSASGGGNITAGDNTATPTVDATGTYTVTVTDSDNGCTATDSVVITQDITAPTAEAGASD
ncbi:MAG: hypothetical protein ACO3MB_05400, partial [Saprospiraceae bacterium]